MDEMDLVSLVLIVSLTGSLLALGSLTVGMVAFIATLAMIALTNLMVLATYVMTKDETQSSGQPENNQDLEAIEKLRKKYVDEDINDEEFEHMLERLLETDQELDEQNSLSEVELSREE